MKRIFCLLGLVALCACDRPQYDVQLVCSDGAKGQLLVDAQIYEAHADLTVKRLDKELRWKALNYDDTWLADHLWLYNQVPQIDDSIKLELPVNENNEYEIPNKVKLDVRNNNLTGGVEFTLWHAADNNLRMNDGTALPDGKYMIGAECDVVIFPINVIPENIPDAKVKEIKNCMNYIDSQLYWTSTADEQRLQVYDEKTGREMFIGEEQIKEIFGDIKPNHFYLENIRYYGEDAMHACDVAQRLREYIQVHIDTEYIRDEK